MIPASLIPIKWMWCTENLKDTDTNGLHRQRPVNPHPRDTELPMLTTGTTPPLSGQDEAIKGQPPANEISRRGVH